MPDGVSNDSAMTSTLAQPGPYINNASSATSSTTTLNPQPTWRQASTREPTSSSIDSSNDSENSNISSGTDDPTTSLNPLIKSPLQAAPRLNLSGRVINVLSNLPHAIVHTGDQKFDIRHRRGNSALYSALSFIEQQTDWESVTVAWTGEIETTSDPSDNVPQDDVEDLTPEKMQELEVELQSVSKKYGEVHPVWLLGKHQSRWREYAESIIWPILHYIQGPPTDGRQEKKWWCDYVTLNEAYAEKIISNYKTGDIIWIHDYYLFLLPQILRMKLPNAYIGVFLHSPFPSSEYFRCLPKRKELLEGILGANIVASQSYAFSRHFISCCARLLGVETAPNYISAYGMHVTVDTIPIGIDTVTVEREAFLPDIDEKVKALRQLYPDKKIIIGRDRLDSVRGVVQKLYAFEMFLTLYPEWIEKVVLIQVTSPAYSNTAKTEKKISEMVTHINGKYGGLHFSPVQHFPRHIARDEYFALLRVADLGLITSVRDGMNTTSLEFVVCQKYNNSPLVLSEFTGTAGTLVDAMQVNPWDSVGVAHAIHQCLEQSNTTNEAVQKKLYSTVTYNTVQYWVQRFLSRLVRNLESHDQTHMTPTLDRALLLHKYTNAKRRLFLFDYDGTLTPIVRDPAAAIPTARLHNTLLKLTKDPRNVVWIISGRDGEFLDKWLGDNKQIGFSAEHGCFIKPVGSAEWTNLAEQVDMSWQEGVKEVFNYFTERTQGSSIEYKRAALTWHYRRADPEFGVFQARECRNHLEQTVAHKYDIEVMAGKANLEVRPRKFNKGEIVKSIIEEFGDERPEFIICLGDDATDEDMFKALHRSTVHGENHHRNGNSNGSGKDDDLEESADLTAKEIEKLKLADSTETEKVAYERSADGLFPVTVGPANKLTTATWHLIDPAAVLDTLSVLTGEMGLGEVAGYVSIDSQGKIRQKT